MRRFIVIRIGYGKRTLNKVRIDRGNNFGFLLAKLARSSYSFEFEDESLDNMRK
jgi:hypothetical protein